MKKIYLLFIAFSCFLVSCSEDAEVNDARNAFVGKWDGSYEATYYADGETYKDAGSSNIIVSKGSSENEIIIDDEGELFKAKVSGSTFIFIETVHTEDFDGTAVNFKVSGSGKIKDGDLTYKMLLKNDEYGMTATGDYNLVKSK